MADPVTSALLWWQRYGAIGVGLIVGTMAKYGLTLNEGRRLTWRGVIADMLLLGMLGLIAIAIADWMQLTGNWRVLAGALAAVSSDRLVRLARDRFMKEAEAQLAETARVAPGAALVPAGVGEPDIICAQPGTPDKPVARAGTALRGAFGGVKRPPGDQIDLLRKLDE